MGVGTKNSNAAEAAAVDAERLLTRPRVMNLEAEGVPEQGPVSVVLARSRPFPKHLS